jgi:phenylacetate-CoA ligase
MQHAAVTAFGAYWIWLRFGPGYRVACQQYRQRERFSPEEWTIWQQGELKRLLSICAQSVPFYFHSWTTEQKEAAREGSLADLPLLEKECLRRDAWSFVRRDIKRHPHVFYTSGSTGTPIASIWTTQEIRRSIALRETRSANWANVSFTMPRATFSGRIVEPDPHSRGPFYRYNAVEKQVYFSAFHLRPETASQYLDALNRHKVQWITGYAVSTYLLAKFAVEQAMERPRLQAVVTTSEKITPSMRRVIQEAFGCPVYEEYSTVENAIFGSECESHGLHISPDVALVEILNENGIACTKGEIGEVVVTTLCRDYQPLIRFRLGDLASWGEGHCPCGRAMPLLEEVSGRIEDVIVGPDGRRMVRFHGIFVDQPNIREGQVVQLAQNHIMVRVVATPQFGKPDVESIQERIRERMGNFVQVDVQRVDSIPRTKAGKFQAVISLLNGCHQPDVE